MAWRIGQKLVCVSSGFYSNEPVTALALASGMTVPLPDQVYVLSEVAPRANFPSGVGLRVTEFPSIIMCSSGFRPAVDDEMEQLRAILADLPAPAEREAAEGLIAPSLARRVWSRLVDFLS